MKALKYILIGLGCLIAVFLVLGLVLPKEYSVARSAVINAPKPVVLDNIKSLKTMDQWTVWSKRDPNIKQEYGGTDGEAGSWLKWDSDKSDVGKGKQEVMAVTENSVDLQLAMEDWAPANVNFMLADTADATKVTWTINGNMPFPWNAFSVFMDMDGMMGKDFEEGLANLKTMSEAEAAHKTYRGYEIKEVDYQPKVFVAKRSIVKFQDIGKFYETNLPVIFREAGKAGAQPAGPPAGLYFTWDTDKQETDMAAALPFAEGTAPKIKGTEQMKAEGKALQIVYFGAYDKVGSAHDAMDDYMKEKNMELNGMVIEEYITDPGTEKDTAKWQTNIYYLVK